MFGHLTRSVNTNVHIQTYVLYCLKLSSSSHSTLYRSITHPSIMPFPADFWPPSTSLLKHIAYAGCLGEVPHYPKDITTDISRFGQSRSQFQLKKNDPRQSQPDPYDLTQKQILLLLYKGGMHGPQNGFRLLVAEKGVKPGFVGKHLSALGDIYRDTAEMVYFGMEGEVEAVEVVRNVEDGHEGAGRFTRRVVDGLPMMEGDDWHVVNVGSEVDDVVMAVRKAVYPPETVTGRGTLLRVGKDTSGGIALVKQGVLPVVAARAIMSGLRGQEGDERRFVVVEPGGIWIYSSLSDPPIFTTISS
jgi:hypothetical protein